MYRYFVFVPRGCSYSAVLCGPRSRVKIGAFPTLVGMGVRETSPSLGSARSSSGPERGLVQV